MIYTKMTKMAMLVAYNAHKDVMDRSGVPYIYHPMHVAEQMKDEITTCVALLHDVVEDTDVTLDDLKIMGFSDEVLSAVKVLTHEKNVSYMDYIANVKPNNVASKVKIEDLKHNSDLTRLDVVDEKTKERVKKYQKALELLIRED